MQRRRAAGRAAEDAPRSWRSRFADVQPPTLGEELATRLVTAVADGERAALVDAARRLGVLRAEQGHAVACVVEDVVALRAVLQAGGGDPARVSELTDAVLVAASTSYVDELRVVLGSKATRDALTGLPNRVAFYEALNHEVAAAARTAPPAVLLVDLDGLAQVNDGYGQLAGDAVLVGVSRLMTRRMREMDIVGRVGREEFAAVLPRTGQRAALAAARRLVHAAHREPALRVADVQVTLSIGVGWLAHPHTVDELVAVADGALERVKAAGGDAALGPPAPQRPDATVGRSGHRRRG